LHRARSDLRPDAPEARKIETSLCQTHNCIHHLMRICLYTATALPKLGGQESVVDSLARHFTALGHQAVVLAPRPRSPLRASDELLPYPVSRHPRFVSTRDFVSWYRTFLIRAHARYRFDLIHCHDVYPTGYLAALSRPRLKVPMVITSHGGDVRDQNPRLLKRGIPARCVKAVREADALISIGPFTEQGFRRIYPQAGRIESIPNGIDLGPYQSRAARPADLDPDIEEGGYFLFLGRLARRKGVDLLLEALAQMPAKSVTPPVELVIAGTGEEQAELEACAGQLNLRDRVRFIGRVEGDAKIWLLQHAICTVMPSRVWEAFPLVLLETYAAGRALVGSAVPGISDLVQEGKTGLLFPEDDAGALAAAMQKMRDDPASAREMGSQSRAVAQHYSWDSVARRHLALYEELISGATSSRQGAG
jgi:glycosyltransferase involved in cell wall biosynthesis